MTSISANKGASQQIEIIQKTLGKTKITDKDLRNIFIHLHPSLRFESTALKWLQEFIDSGALNSISIPDLIVKISELIENDHTLDCEHIAKGIFSLSEDCHAVNRSSSEKKNIFPSCFFGKTMAMIPIKQVKSILPKWSENYEKIQKGRGYDLIYSKKQIFTIIQERLKKRLGAGVITAIHGCLHSLLCDIYLKSDDELKTFVSSIPKCDETKSTNEPIYCYVQQRYIDIVTTSLSKICKGKTIHLCDVYIACLHNTLWPQLTVILFS